MSLILILFIASGLLDILICWVFWRFKKTLSLLAVILVSLISLLVTVDYASWLWAYLLVIISGYRLFVYYRMSYSHIESKYLQRISRLSVLRLWLLELLDLFIGIILVSRGAIYHDRLVIVSFLSFLMATILLVSTIRHIRVTARIKVNTKVVDKQAPTLTIAIPARNETDSLNECLISLLACDYPKLEILVLDDASTTKRTPEIIRSFAHDGVVFVAGQPAGGEWLAKNWAYQQLLNAANGDVILFCGADTRFSKESLRFLVSVLESRNKSVISILPKNERPKKLKQRVYQPLRYAWEICLPRRSFSRPPVLSTCWLAKRRYLNNLGGFSAVSHRVVCESYFAQRSAKEDQYSFFQYDGVISDKLTSDQFETALRLRYPQLHRQPEFVALISLLEAVFMLGSIPLFFYCILEGIYGLALLNALSFILFGLTYFLVEDTAYRFQANKSVIAWPYIILLDIWLMHLSMWRYEFGTVLWKGRSVAPPVIGVKSA